VREGLCVPYPVPPNVDYVDRIRAAAEQARRDGVGLYEPARSLFESPREYRQRRSGVDLRRRPAGRGASRPAHTARSARASSRTASGRSPPRGTLP
jgi:hypothetical protein